MLASYRVRLPIPNGQTAGGWRGRASELGFVQAIPDSVPKPMLQVADVQQQLLCGETSIMRQIVIRFLCLCAVSWSLQIPELTADEDRGSPGQQVKITSLDSIRPADINVSLIPRLPTVNVAVYLAETADQPHGYATAHANLVASFVEARRIFARAGINLKLEFVRRVQVPESWLEVQANAVTGIPAPLDLNAYLGYQKAKWTLTKRARHIFERIIERAPENHRTIYLLYLNEVRMAYFDRTDSQQPMIKSIPTGGLSLPAYLFESRIPQRIRGVITLCKQSGRHGRTIAHELGHKLINVSHEYGEIHPQFEVRGEGGLMLYGKGTEIPSGIEGRWHRERLHQSPFLYHLNQSGDRVWNPDYKEHGHYYDPLYGKHVVRFGVMTDECHSEHSEVQTKTPALAPLAPAYCSEVPPGFREQFDVGLGE